MNTSSTVLPLILAKLTCMAGIKIFADGLYFLDVSRVRCNVHPSMLQLSGDQ